MNGEPIQISAKTLGELAMLDFCPRCFWIKLNCKLPFQIFPGIFSSVDSYSKKITWGYFEKFGKLPDWFSEFGEFEKPIKAPGRKVFFYLDKATNVKLTGIVDDIVQKKDGSYFVLDYKTARYTGTQDKLLPIYTVQLNVYALIAQNCGLDPVSGIGLVYYEPPTCNSVDDIDEAILDDGFKMPFKAHLLPIKLEPEATVLPLLAEVRKLADMKSAPEGLDGCKECKKLNDILGSLK